MKNITLLSTILFLVINILAGFIIPSYDEPKVIASCLVLIFNAIMLMILQNISIKTGFRVSLNIMFPFFGILEFCSCCFIHRDLTNNYAVIILLMIIAMHILTLVAVKTNSEE